MGSKDGAMLAANGTSMPLGKMRSDSKVVLVAGADAKPVFVGEAEPSFVGDANPTLVGEVEAEARPNELNFDTLALLRAVSTSSSGPTSLSPCLDVDLER
jgi:hypothetical protein